MVTLSLVLMLVSASPSTGARENKTARAARLMTEVELAQLADLDRQLEDLRRSSGGTALLSGSIAVLGVGVLIPVAAAVVALVGTVFVGLVGLLVWAYGSTSVLAFIPTMWVAVFSWIPIWGWIAMGVTAAVGTGMLIHAVSSDAPRRAQVDAVQGERKRLISAVLARPENTMLQTPMTTLATF